MREQIPIWKLEVYLRGIAIFSVVLNHSIFHILMLRTENLYDSLHTVHFPFLTLSLNVPMQVFFQEITRFAVPLFIVLAGNFIASIKLSKSTILAQIRKLFIPYIFWTLMGILYRIFVLNSHYSALNLVKAVFLGGGQYGYFFFPLIMQYYALSIIIKKLYDKSPYMTLLISLIMQLFWISSHYSASLALGGIEIPFSMTVILPEALFPRFIFFFVLGIHIKRNSKSIIDMAIRERKKIVLGTILSLVLLLLEHIATYSVIIRYCPEIALWQIINALSPMKITTMLFSFMSVLLLISIGIEGYFSLDVLKRMGSNSFSIFILNGPILLLINKLAGFQGVNHLLIPVFIISIPLCIIIPILLNERLGKKHVFISKILGNG